MLVWGVWPTVVPLPGVPTLELVVAVPLCWPPGRVVVGAATGALMVPGAVLVPAAVPVWLVVPIVPVAG